MSICWGHYAGDTIENIVFVYRLCRILKLTAWYLDRKQVAVAMLEQAAFSQRKVRELSILAHHKGNNITLLQIAIS